MSYPTISPDEVRGREAVRNAIKEAEERQRRKHQLLEGEVQEGTDKFLHGTDGVFWSGTKIAVEKRHLRAITDQEKRIDTMIRLGLSPEVIEHAKAKLKRDRTILLAASFKAPHTVEIADHREEKRKSTIGSQLRGLFGFEQKPDEVIEVEVEES